MRAMIVGLLASTLLTVPAAAHADPDEPRVEQVVEPIQAERAERTPDRPSGWERPQVERPVRVVPDDAPDSAEPEQRPGRVERRSPRVLEVARDIDRAEGTEPVEPVAAAPEVRMVEPPVRVRRERPDLRDIAGGIEGERGNRDTVREWRRAERERRRAEGVVAQPEVVEPIAAPAPVAERDRRDRREGREARNGRTFDVLADRVAVEGWRRDWRRDRRHDWRRHRDHNRHLYRWGFYHDPFGWTYRPWHVGWHLHPRHLSSRFWIADPWRFRLPVVYGPYRWVRYYDDVLLVDLRTGRVVDVIRNFFW